MAHITGLTRRALVGAAVVLPAAARAQGARRQTIRIGVLTDMSGAYRDNTGPTSAVCARQAVEEFGNQGYDVVVLAADHQNKPDVGVGIARQWFSDGGVDMILDVPNSAVALAINGLAREKNKVYVSCGGASADLTGKDCTPNTVHWSYDTFMLAAAVGGALTKAGGDKWFFITVNQGGGPQFQRDAAAVVVKSGGTVLGNAIYPFPTTTDFSSYLLQAQASGANVISFANAGDDTVNCVKQAHEFGLASNGVRLAAGFGTITVAHGIGIDVAQGLIMTESFYWDLNDRTRAWAKRVLPRTPRNMPSAIHAGCYAGTLHYLKAATSLDYADRADGAAVVQRMKAMQAEDDCFGATTIRADGRAMVTPYLLQVKQPSQSKSEWDIFNVLSSLKPEDAALPASACPLVTP